MSNESSEDKPIDLAAEIAKKIGEDSRRPGTFRKLIYSVPRLTGEEYQARRRRLEAALVEAGVESTVFIGAPSFQAHGLSEEQRHALEKMAFNAHLPPATPDEVKMFNAEAHLEMRTAARTMQLRIMSDREYDQMARLFDVPRYRTWKRAYNRSERLDKKLHESKERTPIASSDRWTRTTPCARYIHRHKGKLPKRGNPWRSK